ncbi:DUF2511 domain-containing protein [Embleya sp. NBC_00896]|uniref:DUF2511 domain-containing protein n=1 Tax=Embleya sp. NBC_00896 TaxID=2975961 RepID=UPI00386B7D62|nr:YebY family protein [Embleya sp. NBC_00896]
MDLQRITGPGLGIGRSVLVLLGCVVVFAAAVSLRNAFDDDSDPRPPVHELNVNSTSFTAWPFTVDRATLQCLDGRSVTLLADGRQYALNGAATQAGYPAVDPIRREDPNVPGLRVDLATALSFGQSLCG